MDKCLTFNFSLMNYYFDLVIKILAMQIGPYILLCFHKKLLYINFILFLKTLTFLERDGMLLPSVNKKHLAYGIQYFIKSTCMARPTFLMTKKSLRINLVSAVQ